jgi:hypothetical protein
MMGKKLETRAGFRLQPMRRDYIRPEVEGGGFSKEHLTAPSLDCGNRGLSGLEPQPAPDEETKRIDGRARRGFIDVGSYLTFNNNRIRA